MAHGLADRRFLAGGVAVQLAEQQVAAREQLVVSVPIASSAASWFPHVRRGGPVERVVDLRYVRLTQATNSSSRSGRAGTVRLRDAGRPRAMSVVGVP